MNARKIKLSVHSWQKSIIKMNETELWIKIENFFVEHFQTEKNPPIETLMFLIGIQELGSGQQKYSKDDKITKIGKDRILTGFIPGTMGKAGKLPAHNCKTKGKLVMFITVDKAGNVTNAGRSSGIKDACNITAAVIWTKQYVKAKKSQRKQKVMKP